MIIVRPQTVDGANLVASNIAESETVWSAAASYAAGARVTVSGTHRLYENVSGGALTGVDPASDDGSHWIDVGPTNRWAMFDQLNGTATSDPEAVDVTVQASGRIDSVALLSLANAASVRVVLTTAADGTYYDESFSLEDNANVSDWYEYFFEEVEHKAKLLISGLPVFANPEARVVVTGTGNGDVAVGNLVVGLSKDLGETQHDGAQVGILDYSRKEADDFGSYTIVERPFSDTGNFKMRVRKAQVDGIKATLARYRATPLVWSASADYDSSLIFGFFREANIEIDYPLESLLSVEIEGLT